MRFIRFRLMPLVIVFILLCLAACSSKKVDIDDLNVTKLDHTTLSICFQGVKPQGLEEVIAEAEKRSGLELNVKLDFQFFYMVTDQYFNQVQSLISSGQPCDAFVFTDDNKSILESFVESGVAADITDIFSQYAPGIYSMTEDKAKEYIKVKDRLYAVPRVYSMPERLGVAVREDLLKKYKTTSINNYDEMEAFLEHIKQGEPDIFPLTTYNTSIGLFAQAYGYVIMDYEAGLVYKWDDKEMKLSAWEQTPEYLEAENRLAYWYRKGYISRGHNVSADETVYKTGKWAVMVKNMGDSVYYNMGNQLNDAGKNFIYTEFPLYPEYTASRVSPLYLSFIISHESNDKERVLMFLDWIQASRENYRLFRYGLEGRDYTLYNESISMPEATKSLDDLFVGWYGGSAIMNMNHEGPYWMGDRSFDIKENMKEINSNTEYVPHSGFIPDYTAVNSTYMTRRLTFSEMTSKMEMGTYQEKNGEEYREKMKKNGTDELLRVIQQQLDEWREGTGG